MDIELPRRLTYRQTEQYIGQRCQQSLCSRDPEFSVDWTAVEWVDLPEVVFLLNWSAKLVQCGKSVSWAFAHPLSPTPEIDELRSRARLALGEDGYQQLLSRIHRLQKKLMQGELLPRARREAFSQLKGEAEGKAKAIASATGQWMRAEESSMARADMLAYLNRYDVFTQALRAGINVVPDPRRLPRSLMTRSPETPSMELRPIHSWTDVDALVEAMSSVEELARILGEYANLDVVRRGALARILITELGRNVGEHSESSAAWVCTRLVEGRYVGVQTEGDPALGSFRKRQEGFLEVLVCDNGVGLTRGLEEVLNKDERESVRIRYRLGQGKVPTETELMDYAFDRLSSRKRDIAQMVHLVEEPRLEAGLVASGLYWIWNVVRSHCGVLCVRTGATYGWYDFTGPTGEGDMSVGERSAVQSEQSATSFSGTMIRVCLPLAETHPFDGTGSGYQTQRREHSHSLSGLHSPSPNTRIVWIGDLARKAKPLGYHTEADKDRTRQIGMFEDDYRMRLLRALQREHCPLRDGDALVLDLCGLQHRWAMASVSSLCHFVTEMNYTSTVGRSAVILWNVPTQDGELFERGMEDAIGTYSQLKGFRRAVLLVWDNGQVRFFCGWREAEKLLGIFGSDREFRLDDMGLNTLAEDERARFRRLVSENSHLLEWAGPDQVRIRPWPLHLRMESWKQGIQWFDHLIATGVEQGGVLNSLGVNDGVYYRLPSSGLLVKDFFQFDVVLSNQQDSTRIVWLLAQIIAAVERQGEKIEWIVSVTRPMMSLAEALVDNYHLYGSGKPPGLLARSTVEELENCRKEIAHGSSIILTDVISSGDLCRAVKAVLPDVRWLGILALLDTRDLEHGENVEEQAIQVCPGWDLTRIRDSRLGDAYALSRKRVVKLHPGDVKPVSIIPIDRVNVCPAKYPDLDSTRKREIWPFLHDNEQALQIGHYQAGDYHHYVYYIDALQLLDATDPSSRQTLRAILVHSVVHDLDRLHCDPDKTVLIHPPGKTSYGEEIAKEIQRQTGIPHRLVLYRDSHGGHWRFSPFVRRGISIGGYTAVVIDDGSNTGETLVALLDSATFGQPSRVLAYVGITRLPLYKADLFSRLTGVKGVSIDVKVQFMVAFSVPVYSPRTCPVCRFRRGLSEVAAISPLFAPFAETMRDMTRASIAGSHAGAEGSPFLWRYATSLGVARLREEIELVDYPSPSAPMLDRILANLGTDQVNAEDDTETLLDLAFVLAVEPELALSARFVPHTADLLCSAFQSIQRCREDSLMTYVSLAYELMVGLQAKGGMSGLREHARDFWHSVLMRSGLTIGTLASTVSYALARAFAERGVESEPHAIACNTLAEQLLECIHPRTAEQDERESGLVGASGRVFAREMIAALTGSGRITGLNVELDHTDLLAMATCVASKFWRHASEHVNSPISDLARMSRHGNAPTREQIVAVVGELLQGFYELQQLQHSLSEIERSWVRSSMQRLGIGVRWGHADMDGAIDEYGRLLIQIVEAMEGSNDIGEKVVYLKQAWGSLNTCLVPAFDDIFPVVSVVFDDRWNEWESITGLPMSVAKPLEMPLGRGDDRVFVPRVLLARFFSCAMENLRTAAFRGWTEEQIRSEAYARVEVTSSEDTEGQPALCIRVLDNGVLHRVGETDSSPSVESGTGRGLGDVAEMIRPFGGSLIGPCFTKNETVVELKLRHIVFGGWQHD